MNVDGKKERCISRRKEGEGEERKREKEDDIVNINTNYEMLNPILG